MRKFERSIEPVQTTLLGLAIVIILALLTALVGPLFVDWNRYRNVFEKEASRLVGLPVRVNGAIDARLLPTPSLTLNGIEIGQPGDIRVRARSLDVEFALGPLMRGDWRAAELSLAGPELNLGLDGTGRIDWPSAAIGFDPDALSIERLTVEDGRAVLADAASGTRVVLEKLWFRGDLRSLIGPVKGEGAFVAGDEVYGYRVSAGRLGDDGIKLRLGLDPSDRPLTIEADGILAPERGAPRFEGTISLARIAGLARVSGQPLVNEPWRVTGRVKATQASALLDQFDVQYGPEERALRLTGTAEMKFGSRPQFEGVLSARQLDFDRAMPDVAKRLPLAAFRAIAETFGVARTPIPMRLGIGIDTLTLAGATLQSVRGDLRTDASGWELEKFEFRAPGVSQVQLSGRLDFTPDGLAFAGPARIESNDPKMFLAWIEGRELASQTQARPLRVQGDVTFGQKIAVERLKAELDRETIEGRLAYHWASDGRPPRLEAELKAAELDVDAAIAFANAVRTGTNLERPGEMALAIDVARATIAGFTAREAHARLRLDAGGLQVDGLSVGDLGGAAFSARGHIQTALPAPRGNMNLDLDARELAPVAALLGTVAPQAADRLRRDAERLAPAKLQVRLGIGSAGTTPDTVGKLGIEGRLGGLRVKIDSQATVNAAELTGNAADLLSADLRLDGRLEADDGGFLVSLIGLDKLVTVDRRPGRLSFSANGPLTGDMRIDSRLGAGGFDVATSGTARLLTDQGADLRVTAILDARKLRGSGRDIPLPVSLNSRLSLTAASVRLEDFSGTIAGAPVRGKLAATFQPWRVDGEIDAEAADATALISTAIGLPMSGGNAWSSEPFTPGFFTDLTGRVSFRSMRATLTPSLTARQARGVLRLGRGEIALDELEAELAGGRLIGQLEFRSDADGLTARGRLALSGAEAAAIVPAAGKPPISGRLAAQVDAEGTGRSPAALLGSLGGGGTVTLASAQFAGLDSKAFDAGIRAADQGLTIDVPRIHNLVVAAFDSGRLGVPQLDGAISIRAGQARLAQTIGRADGADLALSGHVDLSENVLDAKLTLTGTKVGTVTGGGRPEVFIALKGPIPAAKRAVDVSALVGWLTLRGIDQQARRLEAIESGRPSALESPPPRPDGPTPPAADQDDARTSSVPPTAGTPVLPPPSETRPAPSVRKRAPLRESGPLTPEGRPRAPAPPRSPLDLLFRPEN